MLQLFSCNKGFMMEAHHIYTPSDKKQNKPRMILVKSDQM